MEEFALIITFHCPPILDLYKKSEMWHSGFWIEIRSDWQMPIMLLKSSFTLSLCYFEPRARVLNWLKLRNIHHCNSQFGIALNDQELHINTFWANCICCISFISRTTHDILRKTTFFTMYSIHQFLLNAAANDDSFRTENNDSCVIIFLFMLLEVNNESFINAKVWESKS